MMRPSHHRLWSIPFGLAAIACASDGAQGGGPGAGSSAGGQAGAAGAAAGAGGQAGAGFGGNSAGSSNGGAAGGGGSGALTGYFVSPTGSDDNPGTESAPFRTITRARDEVRTVNTNMTGDIYVHLRGGMYDVTSTIEFGPQDSGTNGHRIHYQAYPGETPVLSGATRVTGWTQHEGNLYKAPLERSTKLRNLYVDDARAVMANETVTAAGGHGTYSVDGGQTNWAWASGSNSDGVKYGLADVPDIAANEDDLEIVNGTTWNENIVCVREVITTPDNYRGLLLQQPYGAIAQLPGWNAGFSVNGTHTIFNAFEFLDEPGEFYFDKSSGTLYYYPRPGEDMATAEVAAPFVEKLLVVAGTSTTDRVENISFRGITFANTDYNLYEVDGACGKATVQGATIYVAYGDGNWHNSKYEITDTLPAMINVSNAASIEFASNTVKHSGNEGISLTNDVVDSTITGNVIRDIAGSAITVGHPQHLYLGDTGEHARYTPEVEGICTNISITNNLLYDISSLRGFGGHSGITAFFVDTLSIEHNQIQKTAYNGINLGWGWRNFQDSTTCRNNSINYNRFIDTLSRLHDSGAVYTLGQMPDTTINENYVQGIPPATSGPTYGLHNDEGSAYITQNDNVLEIDPGVTYTINCEDFGEKHDLTILRTYATVSKMGADPPNSQIDPPVAVPDNVWPLAQYEIALSSGIEPEYASILLSSGLTSTQDYAFPASCAVPAGTASLTIRSAEAPTSTMWFAPAGTTSFVEGPTMTKAQGDSTSIAVPASAGEYRLHVVDAQGGKLGESAALLRVE